MNHRTASNAMLVVLTCALTLQAADPAVAPADADAVKHVLSAAAGGPGDAAAAVAKIADATLRQRMTAALPDIQSAANAHARHLQLIADLKAVGGAAEFAPGGPPWLRAVAGDDAMRAFDRVVGVDLNDRTNPHAKDYKLNEAVNDAWLAKLDGLTDLTRLDIANSAVKGPGLKHVAGLTNLQSINLTLTPVTDEHLVHLAGLTQLKVLGLASAACDGTGCRFLEKLTKLENLNFHHTPVNDDGLAQIGKMTSLTRLEIVHTFFTDASAAHLADLKHLQRVQIGSTKATGAAVANLQNLPELRELDIHDLKDAALAIRNAAAIPKLKVLRVYVGPIKDEDLKLIAAMPQLEELILGGTQCTAEGFAALERSKSLKRLNLGNSKTPPGTSEKLQAALPGLQILK